MADKLSKKQASDRIQYPPIVSPTLEALYYGTPMKRDVATAREPSARELLAEKLQSQLERFMPAESAKKGARKITGHTYPMGLADITPAGIPLWAYEGGQSLAKAYEAAQEGKYGTAAWEGLLGALGVAPGLSAASKVVPEALNVGAAAIGQKLEPAASRAAQRILERGGLPAQLLQDIGRGGISPLTVFHGSPHKFEKFDISKIGTGEGAQAYGHGLYFAEAPEVAGQYKASTAANMYQTTKGTIRSSDLVDEIFKEAGNVPKGLESSYRAKANEVVRDLIMGESSQEIANKIASSRYGKTYAPIVKAIEALSPSPAQGSLYKVDIPDEAVARMLDWDKPLSEQAPAVRDSLKGFVKEFGDMYPSLKNGSADGRTIYNIIDGEMGTNKIKEFGIPGIKYLDEGSRAAGEGTRNFVLFSDELPRILEVNEKPTGALPWAPGEWKPTQE